MGVRKLSVWIDLALNKVNVADYLTGNIRHYFDIKYRVLAAAIKVIPKTVPGLTLRIAERRTHLAWTVFSNRDEWWQDGHRSSLRPWRTGATLTSLPVLRPCKYDFILFKAKVKKNSFFDLLLFKNRGEIWGLLDPGSFHKGDLSCCIIIARDLYIPWNSNKSIKINANFIFF